MAVPVLNDTVYDVLLRNQEFYVGTGPIDAANQSGLYNEVSKLLTYFALADLRHDFESELDIDIYVAARTKQSIALSQCRYICQAFYSDGSPRFNDLYTWACQTFMEKMTSDKTAKTNFKKYMDDFFSGTGVFNKFRRYFHPDAYSMPFDLSHSTPIAYNNEANKANIARAINPDLEHTAILVDSQMGNPLQNIYDTAETKNRAYYVVNFATTMDAASKPTTEVHTYLKVYIQKDEVIAGTQPLTKELTLFGPNTMINSFNFANSTWATTAQIAFSPEKLVAMTFSKDSKASVNELAVVPVRNMSKSEIQEALSKLHRLPQVEEIGAAHQFKSLGDRLQALSVSKYFAPVISYVLNNREGNNGNLRNDKRAADAGNNINGLSRVTFINDILNLYQNWLLQNNFVDTGEGIITIYKSRAVAAISEADVQNAFIARKRAIHNSIRDEFIAPVDLTSLDSTLTSLYIATVKLNGLRHIKQNDLLKHFVDAEPTNELIRRIITSDNCKVYHPYTVPDFYGYIENRTNTQISQSSYTLAKNDILRDLRELNASITPANISGSILNHINGLIKSVNTIEERLEQLGITEFTFFLALLLIKSSDLPMIKTLLGHPQFYKSIFQSEGRAERHSIFVYKFNNAIQYLDNKKAIDVLRIQYKLAIDDIESFEFDGDIDKLLEKRASINGLVTNSLPLTEIEKHSMIPIKMRERRSRSRSRSRSPTKRETNLVEINFNEIAKDILSKMSGLLNLAIYISAIKIDDVNSIIKEILTKNGLKVRAPAVMDEDAAEEPAAGEPAAGAGPLVRRRELHVRGLQGRARPGIHYPFDPISDYNGTTMRRLIESINAEFDAHYRAGAGGQQFSSEPCASIPRHHESSRRHWTERTADALRYGMEVAASYWRGVGSGGAAYSGRGGGSRSKSLSSKSKPSLDALADSVRLKVFYMNLFLSENKFAGSTLSLSETFATTLLDDYKVLFSKKSDNKYVLMQSSVKQQSLSKSKDPLTVLTIASPSKTKQRSIVTKSLDGKVKSVFKRKQEVKNKLIQQLIAFLWFGANQSAEMKKLEKTLFTSLLPDFVNDLSSVVHYQLFWMPFMNRTTLEYDDLHSKFIEIALPIMHAKPADLTSPKRPSVSKTVSARTKTTGQTKKSHARPSPIKKAKNSSVSMTKLFKATDFSQTRRGQKSNVAIQTRRNPRLLKSKNP